MPLFPERVASGRVGGRDGSSSTRQRSLGGGPAHSGRKVPAALTLAVGSRPCIAPLATRFGAQSYPPGGARCSRRCARCSSVATRSRAEPRCERARASRAASRPTVRSSLACRAAPPLRAPPAPVDGDWLALLCLLCCSLCSLLQRPLDRLQTARHLPPPRQRVHRDHLPVYLSRCCALLSSLVCSAAARAHLACLCAFVHSPAPFPSLAPLLVAFVLCVSSALCPLHRDVVRAQRAASIRAHCAGGRREEVSPQTPSAHTAHSEFECGNEKNGREEKERKSRERTTASDRPCSSTTPLCASARCALALALLPESRTKKTRRSLMRARSRCSRRITRWETLSECQHTSPSALEVALTVIGGVHRDCLRAFPFAC